MSKKNTMRNPLNLVRNAEIEKALRELYSSSEDDSDDGGSTIHENYTEPHINEALDKLQGLTHHELLDILEEERVCSPPIPDPPSFSLNEDEEMANQQSVASTIMPTSSSLIETGQLPSHSVLELQRKSTKKNWLRLFWFMLEVTCINAYIMYSMTHKSKSSSHKEFRLRLARSLIDNFSTRIREHAIFKNKKGGQYCVEDEVRLRNVGHHMPTDTITRKRCRFCSTKKETKRS